MMEWALQALAKDAAPAAHAGAGARPPLRGSTSARP